MLSFIYLALAVFVVPTPGLPRLFSGKESTCQCRKNGFNPWVKKITGRSKWQPIPIFLPRKSHGHRSLAGYSPRGSKSQIWLSNKAGAQYLPYSIDEVQFDKLYTFRALLRCNLLVDFQPSPSLQSSVYHQVPADLTAPVHPCLWCFSIVPLTLFLRSGTDYF